MYTKSRPYVRLRNLVLGSSLSLAVAGGTILELVCTRDAELLKLQEDIAQPGMPKLKTLMQANQITILGDSNHRSLHGLVGFLNDPDFLEDAKQADIRVIGIEIPSDLQSLSDSLAQGHLTKRDFVTGVGQNLTKIFGSENLPPAMLNDLADGIVKAHSAGVRVTFVDAVTPREVELYRLMMKAWEMHELESAIKQPNQASSNLTDDSVSAFKVESELFKLRLSPELNRLIANTVEGDAGHVKAVIFIGAYHIPKLEADFRHDGLTTHSVVVYRNMAAPEFLALADPSRPSPEDQSLDLSGRKAFFVREQRLVGNGDLLAGMIRRENQSYLGEYTP